ncbi:hypothetical protein scyTo_0008153 [Scyliorhinus torazame]|uniref:Uncharacterized protein n=1 Tax=Scyliorhinus torazame TaxID=75743 RepID=A0A401P495_SCYTO|nr:hypothetical protein [Scyliorhinus torazame]
MPGIPSLLHPLPHKPGYAVEAHEAQMKWTAQSGVKKTSATRRKRSISGDGLSVWRRRIETTEQRERRREEKSREGGKNEWDFNRLLMNKVVSTCEPACVQFL